MELDLNTLERRKESGLKKLLTSLSLGVAITSASIGLFSFNEYWRGRTGTSDMHYGKAAEILLDGSSRNNIRGDPFPEPTITPHIPDYDSALKSGLAVGLLASLSFLVGVYGKSLGQR